MPEIRSLTKAFEILDLLTLYKNGAELREIASQLSYPKSTVHAILSTMRDRGVVKQLPSGSYALGIKLFEYGCAVSRGMDISGIAKPYLERLANTTGYGAVISMLDSAGAVSFDYATAPQGVQIMPELGARLPLHCTSQGKLLLSLLSDSSASNLLSSAHLNAYTPHSKTEISDILMELNDVRACGYAVEDGEYKIGLRSVSAPVYDGSGEVRYALTSIGFFRRRYSPEFDEAINATVHEARELSYALGYKEV